MRALVPLWRGKALLRLGRLDDAEAAWSESLRLDPKSPEAGWGLLEIDYLEGRAADARRIALALHEVEPDPHDRVQLLLELVRQDAQPPAPGSLVQLFEPMVERNPGDLAPTLGLGLALVRDGDVDRGLEMLRKAVEGHTESTVAWETWLTGLDDAGQIDELAQAIRRLPAALAANARFARYSGRVAQERQDWKTAAREYRRGLRDDPHDLKLGYRLARSCAARRDGRGRASRARLPGLPGRRQRAPTAVCGGQRDQDPRDRASPGTLPSARRPARAHGPVRRGSRLVSPGPARTAERSGQPGRARAARPSRHRRGEVGRREPAGSIHPDPRANDFGFFFFADAC